MFYDAYETQDALWQVEQPRDPAVDLVEGFALGWLVGGWLRKRLGRK